jgi:hypothetical protein
MELVISINVFILPSFLDMQLKNISEYVLCPHVILLNCDDYMFRELSKRILPSNVYINPTIINKCRANGSLTHGIFSNMVYAKRFNYKYFLVISGRTIFYRALSDLDMLNDKYKNINNLELTQKEFTDHGWHWHDFNQTLLAKNYASLGYKLYASYHEGVCFTIEHVNAIIHFLNSNQEIKDDLFTFQCCVEEFSLQTIATNETKTGFMYIGNGCGENYNEDDINKYTKKILYSNIWES